VDRVTGANSDARRLPVGHVAGRDEVDLRLADRRFLIERSEDEVEFVVDGMRSVGYECTSPHRAA
jgi:hypothetical protein